jgi:hypothetical protein
MRAALALLMCVLWAPTVGAQVAFDAASSSSTTGSSLSFAHTTGAGSDQALYLCIAIDATSNFTLSATYNSVALTAEVGELSGAGRYVWLGRLLSPSSGSNTVNIPSLPGAGTQVIAIAMTFNNVLASDPDDAPLSESGTATSGTESGISSAAGDMVASCLSLDATAGLAANMGQTIPTNGSVDTAGLEGAASYESGAASVDVGYTWTSSVAFGMLSWNMNAAVAAGGTRQRLAPMSPPGAGR